MLNTLGFFFFVLTVASIATGVLPLAFFAAALAWTCWHYGEKLNPSKPMERKPTKEEMLARLPQSHPGPCPQCGEVNWSRGPLRMIPSSGIRSVAFPLSGIASVGVFKCDSCGSYGRYARPHDKPQLGWMLLDRYYGGW